VTKLVRQGWYQDPAGRHEFRWFSQGFPTDLVKDAGETSRDTIEIGEDAPAYESMDLVEPADNGRLVITDESAGSHLEIMNFGAGPVSAIVVPDDPV
jgi:hypothetical protein